MIIVPESYIEIEETTFQIGENNRLYANNANSTFEGSYTALALSSSTNLCGNVNLSKYGLHQNDKEGPSMSISALETRT